MDLNFTFQCGSDVIIRKTEYKLTVVPFDVSIRAIRSNIITAKGQIVIGIAPNVASVLDAGLPGQMLTPTTNPASVTGYEWITAGGSSVSQFVNKSGVTLVNGDCVIHDTANDQSVTTTTFKGHLGFAGVCQDTVAHNATGPFANFAGHVIQVNCDSVAVNKFDYLILSATPKLATSNGTIKNPSCFARALTAKGTGNGTVYAELLAFDPMPYSPVISGLCWWLRPEYIAANYIEGAAVSLWADESGASKNLTGATTTRPLARLNYVNGQAAVQFDGTDDVLSLSGNIWPSTANQPASLFMALKRTGANFPFWRAGGAAASSIILYCSSTNDGGLYDPVALDGPAEIAATYRLLSFIYDGVGMKLYRNNTLSNSSASYAIAAPSAPATYLGQYTSTYPWGGYISEVVAYNRALSDVERAMVFGYLAQKFGVSI